MAATPTMDNFFKELHGMDPSLAQGGIRTCHANSIKKIVGEMLKDMIAVLDLKRQGGPVPPNSPHPQRLQCAIHRQLESLTEMATINDEVSKPWIDKVKTFVNNIYSTMYT